MLNIFNHLAKGTENPISVLLKLPANSEHVMMLRIPYSEPIFQYGPKFSKNTWWYSLTYYHRNVLVLLWYPVINCLTLLQLHDLEPRPPANHLFFCHLPSPPTVLHPKTHHTELLVHSEQTRLQPSNKYMTILSPLLTVSYVQDIILSTYFGQSSTMLLSIMTPSLEMRTLKLRGQTKAIKAKARKWQDQHGLSKSTNHFTVLHYSSAFCKEQVFLLFCTWQIHSSSLSSGVSSPPRSLHNPLYSQPRLG